MELDPDFIKENLNQIGRKEGLTFLKEWIDNSSDIVLRQKALKNYGLLEEGKNFKFFEQLFLSDENLQIRLIAGQILKEKYSSNKKLIPLLEFILKEVDNIELQLFAVRSLNLLDSAKARKTVVEFLKKLIKNEFSSKLSKDLQEIYEFRPTNSIPEASLSICINLMLKNFYLKKCGYHITLKGGKIFSLNCESSNLNKVSNILGLNHLDDLEHLQLARNKLESIEGIQILTKLRTLDLSYNKLEKVENLEDLINLEELIISNNKIRRINNLDTLHHLKKLFLNHNQIEEIDNLSNLVNLEDLNLSHNQISEIKNLECLEQLNRLNLSYNQIEKMKGLNNLQSLMWLYLNNNKISQISGLLNLHQLKGLSLSNNLISNIESLENQVNLKKLELSNNNINKVKGLSSLDNLQELYLDNNSIEELEGFEGLGNLIILYIGRNYISKFNNESIKCLKNLNFLFLNENPLDKESWDYFKKRFKFP
ncbi:MAG: leucine-rich repeat domain-containing protein [Candidatus Odinarchaeota archaeon]